MKIFILALVMITFSNAGTFKKAEKLLGQKKYKEAIEIYQVLAQKDHAKALSRLAFMYHFGHGVKKDCKKAEEFYIRSAQKGYADAYFSLGSAYHSGGCFEKDYKKALYYYEKAIQKGVSIAQENLAAMYLRGQGVPKDIDKAIQLYEELVEKGDDSAKYAAYQLGNIYLSRDTSKAIRYFHISMEKGDTWAPYRLADLYKRGIGVPKDIHKAIRLYEELVKKGGKNARKAAYLLGEIYQFGTRREYKNIIPKDDKKAIAYYKKALSSGRYPRASQALGLAYSMGWGVEKNSQKAVQYYQDAAKGGLPEAYYNLGNAYYFGQGVKKDKRQGCTYWKKAYQKGKEMHFAKDSYSRYCH